MAEENLEDLEDVSKFVTVVLTDPEREVLQEEYDNAGETRNTDTLIRWMIAAVMLPLITALLLFAQDRISRGEFLGVVVSFVAIIYVFLWYRLETRMEGLIQYWLKRLIRLEDLLNPIARVFGGDEYKREMIVRTWKRTHGILLIVIRLFGLIGICMIAFAALYTPRSKERPVGEVLLKRFERMEYQLVDLQKQIVFLQQPPPTSIPDKVTLKQKKKGKQR